MRAYSFLAELSASPEAVHLWLARTLVILAVIGAVIFAVAIVRGVRNAPEHLRYKACASLSIALAFLALGCSTLVFTPPNLCRILMLLVSGVGMTLAAIALRQSKRIGSTGLGIVGTLANTAVQLFSLVLLRPGAAHVIDQPSLRTIVTAINYSASVSAALLVGILAWLWLRQRSSGEQRLPFPKSGILLTLGAAFVWLWLGLGLAVPRMIREGRIGHPDLGEVMQTIFDFGTVGTIPVLMTPLVLYALTYALHLPVSKWRSAWPLSALTAGLLLLMSPLVVSRARRPPAGDSRLVRMCQKISHDPKAGLKLADGDWFGFPRRPWETWTVTVSRKWWLELREEEKATSSTTRERCMSCL
jgi:hypothetical protein